jgi:diguanylate cyclase (GGDEF)-like protein
MRKTSYFLAVAFAIFILIGGSLHYLFLFTPDYPVKRLDTGWNLVYQNDQYLNVNLERLSSDIGTTLSRGETLTLNLTTPLEDIGVPFPAVVFKSQHSAYEVYLDNELFDEKNMDNVSGIRFLGIGYNTISLPSDYAGKKLSIKLYTTENYTRADLVTPLFGNFDDLYRNVLHDVLIPAFTAIFLIVFGFVFLIISLVFFMKSSGVSSQVICSILSTVMGFWMLNFYDAIDFFISPHYATFIEYSAMYMIVPLMFILIHNLHKRHNSNVVIFLSYCSIGFAALFIVLHLLNIVHIHHFQTPYFLMSLIALIILLVYDYFDLKQQSKNNSNRILMMGLTALALSLTVYEISAIFKLFVDYRQAIILSVLVPLGSLFFVVTQLLNHFIFMTRMFAQRKEYASLTQIAYVDNLTEIPNRVSCDKRLLELAESTSNYCILSLDLNGLKEVNDNAGHPAGDRLLKSFAGALRDVFEGTGECFRVGGDEFIVLFTSIEKEVLDEMLMTLEAKLLKLDEEDPEANHSVSYGYAYSFETQDHDTHTVFMLADQRMYEFKRKYYSHLSTR